MVKMKVLHKTAVIMVGKMETMAKILMTLTKITLLIANTTKEQKEGLRIENKVRTVTRGKKEVRVKTPEREGNSSWGHQEDRGQQRASFLSVMFLSCSGLHNVRKTKMHSNFRSNRLCYI